MAYNLSFMDNTTGLFMVVEGINTASDGWLAGLLLISLWVLMIMVYINKAPLEGVLIGSSFIVSIVAGLMFFGGLIPGWVIVLPVLGLISGIMIKYMS